ncbi:unnamed protein product [Cylindrotheca closterium]|uniref:Uncharacterized protein n=1 Tax=Cylindrotheca closterium TaxID=2856 RepID=A0AAD2PXK7_9STRA|nr:unnamed protein product [Cylindrotheca closterium]
MAPNLKHRPLVLQTAAGLDLQDLKTFPPLTSEAQVPQSQGKAGCGDTTIQTSPKQDSSDYWEWNGDNDVKVQQAMAEEQAAELVCADHIIENIIREAPSAGVVNTTSADNDQYWDWSPAQPAASYWDWPSTKNEQRELVRQFDATQTTTVAAAGASDSYWDW